MSDARPIGIFDSGVGGLTIARAIADTLPHESLIYFGDTKHLPYGDKSPALIRRYSLEISQFLLDAGCKSLVIACNSASANAADAVSELAARYHAEMLDVITPVTQYAACSTYRRIGIIATKATITSGLYRERIHTLNPYIEVRELATPLLAPLIEEGLGNTAVSRAVLAHYLNHPMLNGIDALIPGCTHYPLIGAEIHEHIGADVAILDAPTIVAKALQCQLGKKVTGTPEQVQQYRFFVSDDSPHLRILAERFFGESIVLNHHI